MSSVVGLTARPHIPVARLRYEAARRGDATPRSRGARLRAAGPCADLGVAIGVLYWGLVAGPVFLSR